MTSKDFDFNDLEHSEETKSFETRIKELERVLDEAIGYVRDTIGSSYCDTGEDDFVFLNQLEDALGIPRTTKAMFY